MSVRKAKKKRPRGRPRVDRKLVPHGFKTGEENSAAIRRNARLYASGNLTAWLRHSALFHRPAKDEVVVLVTG